MSTPRPDTNGCYPYSIAVVVQIYNIVILSITDRANNGLRSCSNGISMRLMILILYSS